MKKITLCFSFFIIVFVLSSCSMHTKETSVSSYEQELQEYEHHLLNIAKKYNATVFDFDNSSNLFSAEINELYTSNNILVDNCDILDVFMENGAYYTDITHFIYNDVFMLRLKINQDQYNYLKLNKGKIGIAVFLFEECNPITPPITTHIDFNISYEIDDENEDYGTSEDFVVNKKIICGTLIDVIFKE